MDQVAVQTEPQAPQAQPNRPNRAMRRRQQSIAARPLKLSPALASSKLRTAIQGHASEVLTWAQTDRSTPAPVLAVRASAGVGKSEAVLDVLATPEWGNRRVLYLVPTIELAEELRVRAKGKAIAARVLRGRSQPQEGQPKKGDRMCAKHELADALAALGTDITNTLCRSKAATKGGKDEECPFAATCPYLRQLQNKGPGLLIAAHQYIPLTMEGLKAESIDMLIVDESFWQAMCREGTVSTSQFQLARMPGELSKSAYRKGESKQAREERLMGDAANHANLTGKMRRVMAAAIEADKPLDLEMLRDAGLTSHACKWAAAFEYGRLGTPSVTAGMPREEQKRRIQAAKVDEAFSFARVWKILSIELDQPRNQLIGIVRDTRHWNEKKGVFQDVLRTFHHPDAKLAECPLILIDADLDERIARQFYPVAGKVVTLDADWRNVRVRQVLDRATSKNMLAGKNPRADEQQRHENRRNDLWQSMADMAARHGHPMAFSTNPQQDVQARSRRPLLVTYKAVEDEWVEAGLIEAEGDQAGTPKRHALPFAIAHLGNIRGKDCWKHATGVIVAGRLEPSVAAVEALARCVYFQDPEELTFSIPSEDGNLHYHTMDKPILFRDGTEQVVPTAVHADGRVHRVLEQIREAELLQAIARVRPVHRTADQPCEIVVASNVPLPGLLVDEGVTWANLTPDRMRRMELAGVLPDLAADCAAAYPDLFPSADAVRQARSRAARAHLAAASSDMNHGCDKAQLDILYGKCHTLTGAAAPFDMMQVIRVEYRRPASFIEGNRGEKFRAGSATVRVDSGDTEADVVARLLEALPDAVKVAVVGPLPCPVAKPEEALAALENALAFIAPWLDTDERGEVFHGNAAASLEEVAQASFRPPQGWRPTIN